MLHDLAAFFLERGDPFADLRNLRAPLLLRSRTQVLAGRFEHVAQLFVRKLVNAIAEDAAARLPDDRVFQRARPQARQIAYTRVLVLPDRQRPPYLQDDAGTGLLVARERTAEADAHVGNQHQGLGAAPVLVRLI